MPERYRQEMDNEGIYLLHGRIDTASVSDPIRWILAENLRSDPRRRLQLIINSSGGDLSAAFALIDIMRGSAIPVHTIGLGKVASAGLMIFIAGKPGERVLTPNTSILSHQWSWMSQGKEHELVSRTVEFDLITKRIIRHYKRCTGLPKKTIRKTLLPAGDVWLSAKQALKLNICDKVHDLK